MNLRLLLVSACCLLTTFCSAQKNIRVNPRLNLHRDSLKKAALIEALDGFLGQKEQENKTNSFILPEDLLETSALVDEFKGIEKSMQYKDSAFYSGQLTNIAPLNDSEFLVQLSYMGVKDDQPYLRAGFNLIAKARNKHFFFASPLKRNTDSWKRQQIGNCTFCFRDKFDPVKAGEYVKRMAYYDKKLKAVSEPRIFYLCDYFADALQLLGIAYKVDYNGYSSYALSARENGWSLVVAGSTDGNEAMFDPHDLWHARVRRVIPPATVNKPVDEGCAFLYGGSWGLTWEQIRKSFMEKLASKPETNWLELYNSTYDHGDDPSKPLLACYTINSFIVRQLEKDKGFDAVKELLSCGRYEKDNEHYFKALEKLTGINKANFNERVWVLVRAK